MPHRTTSPRRRSFPRRAFGRPLAIARFCGLVCVMAAVGLPPLAIADNAAQAQVSYIARYEPGEPLVTAPHAAPLVIETASGAHRFQVEVRDDNAGRMIGLMHRKSMPQNHGMLFDFGAEEPIAMWMKNTLIPLDMLFIRADGTIESIAGSTTPLSTRIIPSGGAVRYVLELNAGKAKRIGAKPGDQVAHPAIVR